MVDWKGINGSSCVSAIGIEHVDAEIIPQPPTLIHVRFVRGRTYVYRVGSRSYYTHFLDAASKGRFYAYVIKERFDYIRKY